MTMVRDQSRQSLRTFVEDFQVAHPADVVRVKEEVGLDYDLQAVVLELERRRRFPLLLFERVRGSETPIVANVMASRRGLAFALSVD